MNNATTADVVVRPASASYSETVRGGIQTKPRGGRLRWSFASWLLNKNKSTRSRSCPERKWRDLHQSIANSHRGTASWEQRRDSLLSDCDCFAYFLTQSDRRTSCGHPEGKGRWQLVWHNNFWMFNLLVLVSRSPTWSWMRWIEGCTGTHFVRRLMGQKSAAKWERKQ